MPIDNYSSQQLIESSQLSQEDLEKINTFRGKHNNLGFAYQLVFVRLFNYLPKQKPFEPIDEIVSLIALQLSIDSHAISEYSKYREHIARHQMHIRNYLKLSYYTAKVKNELRNFLFEKSQQFTQTTILLAEAKSFLKSKKVLQPSDSTLERMVIAQREKVRLSIFEKLGGLLNHENKEKMDKLLVIEYGRTSRLEFLKQPPGKPSTKALLRLSRKGEMIEDTGILLIDITWINNNYQRILTKYVYRCSSIRIKKLKAPHRYVALVCFLHQVHNDTLDCMVDMYFKIMTTVYSRCENKIDLTMKKNRKNIRKSLSMFKTIGSVVLNNKVSSKELRKVIFSKIPREDLKSQLNESEVWLTGKFSHVFHLLMNRYSYLRQFSPSLLSHLQFESESQQTKSLLKAIDVLKEMNSSNKRKLPENCPIDFIPKNLKNLIAPNGEIDRKAWECALLTSVRDEIKSGNLSVKDSKRFGKLSHFFMPRKEWESIRSEFFKRANLPENPLEVAEYLMKRSNAAYDLFLSTQSTNEYAKVENNKWVISTDDAESLSEEEEMALKKLRYFLASHMRTIKLPQLLIEVDNDLNFTKEFMPQGKEHKRNPGAIRIILVTLMAHGCFIGPHTMARLTEDITYEQIRNATDWQFTEEAQRLALAILVNAISQLDVTHHWGDGSTSSSDSQRYEYKRKSIRQTFSTKFRDFALEFYTFVADNYAPYFSMPIECTEC